MLVLDVKYLRNKEWHYINENGDAMLTDIVPYEIVIEFNELHAFSASLTNSQPTDYIDPQQFFEMRKRINYPEDKILEEIKLIYTVEEITAWRSQK